MLHKNILLSAESLSSNEMISIDDLKSWHPQFFNPLQPLKQTNKNQFGIELEMFLYRSHDFTPFGTPSPHSTEEGYAEIKSFFEKIMRHSPINSSLVWDHHSHIVIGVKLATGGNFSVEPGGQIEYSSKPCDSLQELIEDVYNAFLILEKAANKHYVFLTHGTNPLTDASLPLLVPKFRYEIMTHYFSNETKKESNKRGLHMMRHSGTVQPNISVDSDDSEAWGEAAVLANLLVPATSYLFRNSSYFFKNKSEYWSERQMIWENMDLSRSGIPSCITSLQNNNKSLFDKKNKVLKCYTEWALQANVFYIEGKDVKSHPQFGELTFQQWIEKPELVGRAPTWNDWNTHLTTLFPHVRIRHFFEIRNIDAQPFSQIFAPLVLFKTLLQDDQVRKDAFKVVQQKAESLKDLEKQGLDVLEFVYQIAIKNNDNLSIQIIEKFKEYSLKSKVELSALDFVRTHAVLSPSHEIVGLR